MEEWRPVPWHKDYIVSNYGNIRSLKFWKDKVMKKVCAKSGYINISLSWPKKRTLLHRLVALAFIWKSDLDINHKNWIKTDNRVENLEYVTQKENIRHAFENNLIVRVKWPLNKKNKPVKMIKDGVERIFYSIKHAKDCTGINNICAVLKGKLEKAGGAKWEYVLVNNDSKPWENYM